MDKKKEAWEAWCWKNKQGHIAGKLSALVTFVFYIYVCVYIIYMYICMYI